MFSNIGMSGLILIVIMLIVVFGPKKLPEIGKSIGKSLREFKSATSGNNDDEDTKQTTVHTSTPTPSPAATTSAASVVTEENKTSSLGE